MSTVKSVIFEGGNPVRATKNWNPQQKRVAKKLSEFFDGSLSQIVLETGTIEVWTLFKTDGKGLKIKGKRRNPTVIINAQIKKIVRFSLTNLSGTI